MIISLRAKSERNYLQNSSQLRLLRKFTFRVFSSHDHEHMTCFIKRVLHVLIRFASHDIKLAKVHLRSKRNYDEFWRKFISDFARNEIIMKSSFELCHIANRWDCWRRCRCHRTWQIELRVGQSSDSDQSSDTTRYDLWTHELQTAMIISNSSHDRFEVMLTYFWRFCINNLSIVLMLRS
jgi:hypothetical protein